MAEGGGGGVVEMKDQLGEKIPETEELMETRR